MYSKQILNYNINYVTLGSIFKKKIKLHGRHDQRHKIGAIADVEFSDRASKNAAKGERETTLVKAPTSLFPPSDWVISLFLFSSIPKRSHEISTDIRREKYLRNISGQMTNKKKEQENIFYTQIINALKYYDYFK